MRPWRQSSGEKLNSGGWRCLLARGREQVGLLIRPLFSLHANAIQVIPSLSRISIFQVLGLSMQATINRAIPLYCCLPLQQRGKPNAQEKKIPINVELQKIKAAKTIQCSPPTASPFLLYVVKSQRVHTTKPWTPALMPPSPSYQKGTSLRRINAPWIAHSTLSSTWKK